MTEVACQVEECRFWSDNVCTAKSIEVRSSGTRKVSTSDDTACETFMSKQ
ncbi:DUF1540 domain-containing protein [Carboxydothermus ferrireducens]|uniref:DUF1540 domain-containing protein n=1 Tax=Carboxydothermus ferrireducens DSM 11255 TaxID=1119529 RepID=A0ABX2RAQ7_9THEO|nr:DUF1540 domain-containing protein [Carboxydothermus ferrireducens]NYE56935.1 hypothetical protein [Carboxydothermus ferrireducens DSM 11255]